MEQTDVFTIAFIDIPRFVIESTVSVYSYVCIILHFDVQEKPLCAKKTEKEKGPYSASLQTVEKARCAIFSAEDMHRLPTRLTACTVPRFKSFI